MEPGGKGGGKGNVSIRLVNKFEPVTIKQALGWQDDDIGYADFFLFIDHALLSVVILRRTPDKLLSDISSGMIQHMLATVKHYDECILVIEGKVSAYKNNDTNFVKANGKETRFTYAAYQAFLLSMQRQGVMVFNTGTIDETAQAIKSLSEHYDKEEHSVMRRKPSLMFDVTPQIEFLTGLPFISLEIATRLLAIYNDPYKAIDGLLCEDKMDFLGSREREKIRQVILTHD